MDNFINAMTYDYPERIPVSIGILPVAWKKYPKELKELTKAYPDFFRHINNSYAYNYNNLKNSYKLGETVDSCGCVE